MDGHTAVKFPRGGYKQVTVSGYTYVFVPQHNITLAWIKDKDVQSVLSVKRGCCGGKKQQFFLATETDIRRWASGGR